MWYGPRDLLTRRTCLGEVRLTLLGSSTARMLTVKAFWAILDGSHWVVGPTPSASSSDFTRLKTSCFTRSSSYWAIPTWKLLGLLDGSVLVSESRRGTVKPRLERPRLSLSRRSFNLVGSPKDAWGSWFLSLVSVIPQSTVLPFGTGKVSQVRSFNISINLPTW